MKNKGIKITISFCIVICLRIIESTPLISGNLDSLKNELSKAKEDVDKMKISNLIALEFVHSEQDKSLSYAEQGLRLALKLNDKEQTATALNTIGAVKDGKGDFNTAMNYYNRSLAIYRQLHDTIEIARELNNIAGVFGILGDKSSAIKCYLEILKFPSIVKNKEMYAKTLEDMAFVYSDQQNYAEALKLDFEALNINSTFKNKLGEAADFYWIADVYAKKNDFEKAFEYNFKSLEIGYSINDKQLILDNLNDIGCNYRETKKFKEALDYFQRGLKIAQETDDKYSIALDFSNISACYADMNQTSKAIEMTTQSLALAKQIKNKKLIEENYYNLWDEYEKNGNCKEALKYSRLHALLQDTIYNEENATQINELSAKYESEKKEKEIALLNIDVQSKQKDEEILNTRIQKRNSIIYGTVIGAVLLLLTFVLLFNRRQLIQKSEHQIEISKQRENTMASVVQAQENERMRISKDLHDSVGTYLSTLKINLQLYEGLIPKEKTDGYQNAIHLIDKTAVELRNIMKNLSNETLQESGLVSAFEELISRVNTLGVTHFDFYSHGMSERISKIIELSLYRVGQELLNNCVKYAHASNATLQLIADENNVTLMLEDNGVGFDVEHPKLSNENHGMGIKNIRERINFIKGTIRIESTPINGTLIVIEVPKKINE